jgi:hypothetical protein
VRVLRSAEQEEEKAIFHARKTLDVDFCSKITEFFDKSAYSLISNKPKHRNT